MSLVRTHFPRNKRFRLAHAHFEELARRTGSKNAGQHLVFHNGKHFRDRNKIAQAPYMPAPPKGFIYVRDDSASGKQGIVPKLVRR